MAATKDQYQVTVEQHSLQPLATKSDASEHLYVSIPRQEVVAPEINHSSSRKWYRQTFFSAFILGMCNFMAPGLWGAMNSLGGGGEAQPWLVNTANALTFCLMILTCLFSSVFVKYLGIKYTVVLGTVGFCPYTAGLYCKNRYGTEWAIIVGATFCGLTAGIFWMSEAAVALTYPEPYNRGRFTGFWLGFRVLGQTIGGAINLGFNAKRDHAGSINPNVYRTFIALTGAAPLVGLALPHPSKAQRSDGKAVQCSIPGSTSIISELKAMHKCLIRWEYLCTIPLIAQALFAEAVFFTFQGLWLTVRARALGSFVGGLAAMLGGNAMGMWLDSRLASFTTRIRWAFVVVLTYHGILWIWGAIIVTKFRHIKPIYDWDDRGFGNAFAWYTLQVIGFQANYMFLYFIIDHLALGEEEKIRYAGLLRATESAVQAVAYGLCSILVMGEVGAVYINLALWGIALLPGWMVVRQIAGSDNRS